MESKHSVRTASFSSGGKYTKEHGVKRLVYLEEHEDPEIARKRELQIKDWSRKKKKKLINGDWNKDW